MKSISAWCKTAWKNSLEQKNLRPKYKRWHFLLSLIPASLFLAAGYFGHFIFGDMITAWDNELTTSLSISIMRFAALLGVFTISILIISISSAWLIIKALKLKGIISREEARELFINSRYPDRWLE